MMKNRRNGGFTMVELVIAMATGTLVFFAASLILLLGLRINNMTTGTIIRQNTTTTVLTVLERMASEGTITSVVADGDSWEILNSDKVVFSYDSERKAIFTGKAFDFETIVDGNPIMVDVYASHAVIDENGVLTLAIQTEDGSYQSSVYCRTLNLADSNDNDNPEYDDSGTRGAFLDILYSQYRMKGGAPNPGVILDSASLSTGQYFSEWYIGDGQWGQNNWNKDTPWCACYISWALDKMCEKGYLDRPTDPEHPKWYANVDELMYDYFKKGDGGSSWNPSEANGGTTPPTAGDIVFFDWLGGNDPAHVGVVLNVNGGKIYTIEGNSAGMIAVRQYPLSDNRIIGYGILNWKAD